MMKIGYLKLKPHLWAPSADLTEMLQALRTSRGPAYVIAIKSITRRASHLLLALIKDADSNGFFERHPIDNELLEWIVNKTLVVSGEGLHQDSVFQARTGRPGSSIGRNTAISKAVVLLLATGHTVATACELVAGRLLTLDGVDGFNDNLSARSVQRIYQVWNKEKDSE